MDIETIREAMRDRRLDKETVTAFVKESNAIENIHRPPTKAEMDAHTTFLMLEDIKRLDIINFVKEIEPKKGRLRDQPGMNVFIGPHTPRPGGPAVVAELDDIVNEIYNEEHPYIIHAHYETLHPFMDGNGRSGRVIWAWAMMEQNLWPGLAMKFLRPWYYQSLDFFRNAKLEGKMPLVENE